MVQCSSVATQQEGTNFESSFRPPLRGVLLFSTGPSGFPQGTPDSSHQGLIGIWGTNGGVTSVLALCWIGGLPTYSYYCNSNSSCAIQIQTVLALICADSMYARFSLQLSFVTLSRN